MKEKNIVDTIYTRSKKDNLPTLLRFQNGKLSSISKDKTSFSRVQRKNFKTKGALVVAHGQIYHGQIDAEEADELTDTYICVKNKSTNQVCVIPIEQVRLNNYIYNQLKNVQLAKLSKKSTQDTLLKQFGGRKASRYVTNQAKNIVNIEVLKPELNATVDETVLNTADDSKVETEKNFEQLRPKFNKEATKLHEVYNIEDLIPADLLEYMEEEAKVVYSTDLSQIPITSEYLRNCIDKIQRGTQSLQSFLHLKVIIYMDCLMNLIKSRARLMKKLELSRITEKVENDVRIRFSDPNNQFHRTVFSKEKATCYFIVMALLLSPDYEIDIKILAQELCTPRAKIVRYAHIVNARLKTKSDILSLRLPSNVPPLKAKFSRKSI